MRVAVMNYCGTVGKTTIASHLLAPRMKGAPIYAIETVNETAAELGLDVEKMRGNKYGELFKALMVTDSAIVDVGASNAEEFLGRMARFDGSHVEFDFFIVPVTPGNKEQTETIKTLKALQLVGVPQERIRTIFNRVQSDVDEEFAPVFGWAKASRAFVANPAAAIYENDLFNMLTAKRLTISRVLEDETDYRGMLRTLDRVKDAKQIAHATDMHALKSLARAVNHQLDSVYEELFKAAA